jgi:hypothetical protein
MALAGLWQGGKQSLRLCAELAHYVAPKRKALETAGDLTFVNPGEQARASPKGVRDPRYTLDRIAAERAQLARGADVGAFAG